MGWAATRDPLGMVDMEFDDLEGAIRYCKENGKSLHRLQPNSYQGFQYEVAAPITERKFVKDYGAAFAYKPPPADNGPDF